MATVFDVARYILEKRGPMSAMKLQKLVYYSQAWSLVWDDRALFPEPIEAWANGPVVRTLYAKHRLEVIVEGASIPGDPARLDRDAKKTIDVVLKAYGDRTAQWLSDLTHSERPWKNARKGIPDGEPSRREISLTSMQEYYSTLK